MNINTILIKFYNKLSNVFAKKSEIPTQLPAMGGGI